MTLSAGHHHATQATRPPPLLPAGDLRGVADCCAQAGAALKQRGASDAALKWLGQAVVQYKGLKPPNYEKCIQMLLEEPSLASVGADHW